MVGPHFHNGNLMVFPNGKNCQRYTDMIVEVTFRILHTEFFCQYGTDQLFGGSFSIAAGKADNRNTEMPAMFARQFLKKFER